jgi:hypothetical protein
MEAPAAMIASFALCYAGLSGLCLAMDKHHRQALRRSGSAAGARGLRAIGGVLLALSGVYSVIAWGASVGPIAWFGMLSAAAVLIVVLLPYAPRALAHGAVGAGVGGLLIMMGVALT